jgi:uncharacterized Zn-finger protein
MARQPKDGEGETRVAVQIMLGPAMREFVKDQPGGGQQEYIRGLIAADMAYKQDDEYRRMLEVRNTGVSVCPGCGRTIRVEQEDADGYIFSCPFCDRVLNISQTGTRPDNAKNKE